MVAEAIRHAITQGARYLSRSHLQAKPKLHHDFEKGAIKTRVHAKEERVAMLQAIARVQSGHGKLPARAQVPPAWQSRPCPAPLTTAVAEGLAALGWGRGHLLAAHG